MQVQPHLSPFSSAGQFGGGERGTVDRDRPPEAGGRLLTSQQTQAGSKGAALKGAKGQKFWRIDVGVNGIRIAMVRNVVEAGAHRPVVAEQMEPLFYLDVERKIFREVVKAGRANEALLAVRNVERKSAPSVHGVGDLCLLD